MKKSLVILLLFCCIQTKIFSQSVYTLDLRRDLIIGAISLGIGIAPFFIDSEPERISGILNKNEVNSFDRSLMFSYKRNLDLFSDNSPYALALLPVISMIPNFKNGNIVLTYGIMYSQALLLNYGTVFTLKGAINKYRPYMYDAGIVRGKENDYHNSFPSSAASFAFLSATFLSVTFSQEFPDSKWKLPIILGSYTMAAGVAAGRLYSGTHFLSDVLVGAVIGSLYGGLMPLLHLNNSNKLTVLPNANGIGVSLRF